MAEASTLPGRARRIQSARGFTYLSLIIVVAIVALLTASTIKLGSVLQRSRAEQALLEIGGAFSDALKSYADATPQGQPTQPPSLKELLKDPRFPGTRRHLRKIFVDPMTGKAEWGIVYRGDKVGVLAVYSLSDAKPVKIGNFPARYSGFEGKSRISEWKFMMAADTPQVGNQAQTSKTVSDLQQDLGSRQQNLPAPISPPKTDQPEPAQEPLPAMEESASPSEKAPPSEPEPAPAEQRDM